MLAWAGLLMAPAALHAQDARRAESPRPSVTSTTAVNTAPSQARRDSAVTLARRLLGRRYRFGGTTPDGFDCSGFTKYLMRALGYELPRTAAQQAQVGREVPRDPRLLRPGDLLTFGRGGRVTHIGMYIGNGRFVHASTGAGRIVEADLDRTPSHLVRAWYGVRRLLADDDSATAVAARTGPAPAPR
ncbi:MAG TPA: C40 family peptidase [Longimicrobium sp.]|nr:C40 family peptidase [Longimicrobium sp.]